MASVSLDFISPDEPDLVSLLIYEADNAIGPFALIETVTPVGTYPNYIRHYTTDQAVSEDDWFSIQWEDTNGGRTEMSSPIQGGTKTLVGQIVDRVMLRTPSANPIIVNQLAEWAVSYVMNTNDPYDTTLTATYAQLEGMTLLVMASFGITTITSSASAGESYSAGLVSQKSSSSTTTSTKDLIDYLLLQANRLLGISMTFVMLLEEIDPTGIGATTGIEEDVSRGIITEFTT